MLWEMVLQFWYVFWAVMTILIKGLKIRSNFVAHSELGPSTCGLCCWCHLPRQQPCHHYYPRHRQVNSHIILHVTIVWRDNWICDENYTVCDVYFRHRKRVWVGLWGPGDIIWRFQNVMDEAIYDEILKKVTRCDLWCSIHDAIWDRHRYYFMTVF